MKSRLWDDSVSKKLIGPGDRYNSVVFGALATNEWSVVLAPSDLDPTSAVNHTTQGLTECFDTTGMPWRTFAEYLSNGTYKRMSAGECNQRTGIERSHGLRLVVGLSDDLSLADGGDLAFVHADTGGIVPGPSYRIPGTLFSQPTWAFSLPTIDGSISYDVENFTLSDCTSRGDVVDSETACADADRLATWLDNWSPQWLDDISRYVQMNLKTPITVHGDPLSPRCGFEDDSWYRTNASRWYTTDGCLIIETEDRCKLAFSLPLCLVVLGAAAIKVAAMFLAAKLDRSRTAPLLTVGDAVASFMTQSDSTTLGQCWISRHEVGQGTWKPSSHPASGRQLRPRGLWIRASSFRRWMLTLLS